MNKNNPSNVLNSEEEKNLLELAKTGDLDAFCKVFDSYRSLVAIVAGRLVGPDDADDVAMETFLKAWQGLPALRGKDKIRPWLCKIARNCALDFIRDRNRIRDKTISVSDPYATKAMEIAEDMPTDSPMDQTSKNEEIGRLRNALARLSDAHRVTIQLRYLDGLSYGEIAAATGVSIGTVMSRLFHAKRKLAKELSA